MYGDYWTLKFFRPNENIEYNLTNFWFIVFCSIRSVLRDLSNLICITDSQKNLLPWIQNGINLDIIKVVALLL